MRIISFLGMVAGANRILIIGYLIPGVFASVPAVGSRRLPLRRVVVTVGCRGGAIWKSRLHDCCLNDILCSM